MKNIKKALVLGLAFLGVGAITSCDNKKDDGATQVTDDAKEAIEKVLLPQNDTTVTADFTVVNTVKYNGETVNVTWKSSNDLVKFVTADGKTSTQINFKENLDKDVDVTLTAEVKIGDKTAAKTFQITVPKYKIYTIAEADAAKSGASLAIKGVVVAKEPYDASYKNANVYLSAENGGFEAYRLACTQEQYNELTQGTTIIVSGPKSYYSGLRELTPATYTVTTDAKVTVPVEDLTSLVTSGTGISDAYQCHLATLKDLEIVSIGDKTQDAYSIVVGDSSDTKKQMTIYIQKYFCKKGSDLRKEIDGLNLIPGQKITVTGFVGWNNAPQIMPFATGAIVAGEKKPADEIGYTLLGKTVLPAKVYGVKTIVLPTTLTEAGLSDDKFAGYTMEWSATSANVTLGEKEVAAKAATDTTPAVPAYTTTTVTTKKVDADEDVVLTLKVKDSAGEEKFNGTVTLKLVKEIVIDNHDAYVAAAVGDSLTIQGTITYLDKGSSKATFALTDEAGKSYYVYNFTLNDANKDSIAVGKKVIITGPRGEKNNVIQLSGTMELLKAEDGTVIEPTPITELPTVTADLQAKYVTFTGKVTDINGRNVKVTVGEGDAAKEIAVYLNSNYDSIQSSIQKNDTVTVKGIISVYKTNGQVITLTSDSVVKVTA